MRTSKNLLQPLQPQLHSRNTSPNGIAIADVVNRCRGILSKSYVYDILNGTKRNPSRDVVLLLCIAVHADRKQTRRLLEKYGHRDLYAKDTRDIIIATYINNKEYDIDRINDDYFSTIYHLLAPSINRQILPYIHPL